jgi:hypothetical protein
MSKERNEEIFATEVTRAPRKAKHLSAWHFSVNPVLPVANDVDF